MRSAVRVMMEARWMRLIPAIRSKQTNKQGYKSHLQIGVRGIQNRQLCCYIQQLTIKIIDKFSEPQNLEKRFS